MPMDNGGRSHDLYNFKAFKTGRSNREFRRIIEEYSSGKIDPI